MVTSVACRRLPGRSPQSVFGNLAEKKWLTRDVDIKKEDARGKQATQSGSTQKEVEFKIRQAHQSSRSSHTSRHQSKKAVASTKERA